MQEGNCFADVSEYQQTQSATGDQTHLKVSYHYVSIPPQTISKCAADFNSTAINVSL